MKDWRAPWGVWAAVTILAVPASAVLWFVGGQGWCGEEDYDSPPGSAGDTLCQTLVHPVVPWLLLAALPVAIALFGGFVAIRLRNRRLFLVAMTAPFVLLFAGVFATLALL